MKYRADKVDLERVEMLPSLEGMVKYSHGDSNEDRRARRGAKSNVNHHSTRIRLGIRRAMKNGDYSEGYGVMVNLA